MKILAAIMDITFVKKYHKQYSITKVRKCLVYDPTLYCHDSAANTINIQKKMNDPKHVVPKENEDEEVSDSSNIVDRSGVRLLGAGSDTSTKR